MSTRNTTAEIEGVYRQLRNMLSATSTFLPFTEQSARAQLSETKVRQRLKRTIDGRKGVEPLKDEVEVVVVCRRLATRSTGLEVLQVKSARVDPTRLSDPLYALSRCVVSLFLSEFRKWGSLSPVRSVPRTGPG